MMAQTVLVSGCPDVVVLFSLAVEMEGYIGPFFGEFSHIGVMVIPLTGIIATPILVYGESNISI